MLFDKNIRINIYVALLTLLWTFKNIGAHKCYVCGEDDQLSCDNFDPMNEIFLQECPKGAQGCSIQIKAIPSTGSKVITRSCEIQKVEDCKTANSIQYCHCSWNFCNKDEKTRDTSFSDDEDMFEGSGGNSIDESTKNVSNHIEVYMYNTYILLIVFLCN